MFNLFKKKTQDRGNKKGTELEFHIDGMHCASCSMNIDGELEDLAGVLSASTSYAKAVCKVEYDSAKVSQKEITAVISKLGYKVK